MSKKFWVQTKARDGEYVDSLGTDDIELAANHAKWLAASSNVRTRMIKREEVVLSVFCRECASTTTKAAS